MQVAPYDFLQVDDQLSAEAVESVHKDWHTWVSDGIFPLLPWSCCVFESIPWEAAPNYAPYSIVKPMHS